MSAALLRRLIALVVVAGLAAAFVAINRTKPKAAAVTFGAVEPALVPTMASGDALDTAWYCSGVPAAKGGGSTIAIVNPSDAPMRGRLTVVPSSGTAVRKPVEVAPRSQATLAVGDIVSSSFAAAMVEVSGTNAVVEQTGVAPRLGASTSPCASSTSSTWYFVDGATTVDAAYSLLLFNPMADDAVVDLSFLTIEGARTPQALQGYVVPARSLRVVQVDDFVRREPTVATIVKARTGRLIAGRYQLRSTPPRRGALIGMGAPGTSDTWWYASGQKGDGVTEKVVLINPADTDVSATVTVYPAEGSSVPAVALPTSVPARATTTIDLSQSASVPVGRHALLVTTGTEQTLAAEHFLDLTGQRTATLGTYGMPIAAARWIVPASPPAPATATLSVLNPSGVAATVSVSALTSAGVVPVEGLQNLALPGAATLRLALPPTPLGRGPLEVVVDGGVAIVERLVIPGPDQPGASLAFAIPGGS